MAQKIYQQAISPGDYVRKAQGPYHDFWLCPEGERAYKDYWGLVGRKDAPIRISHDLLQYFYDTLFWFPAFYPGDEVDEASKPMQGLHLYGPSIINHTGGQAFGAIFAGWAQLLSQGPETMVLTSGRMSIDGEPGSEGWHKLKVNRAELLDQLNKLALWGSLAATGNYYILHLGV